jgi:hypothetical protein
VNTIPLLIDATQTNIPNNMPISVYIVGLVGGIQYRLDATGMPTPMKTDDADPSKSPSMGHAARTFPDPDGILKPHADVFAKNYPSNWADYGIPVSRTALTSIDLSQITPANCPGLGLGTSAFSGRIYISAGFLKLPITPISKSQYTAPALTVDAPGALTLYDWIEFSYDANGIFNGNTTQVDQFGFGLTLSATPDSTPQGKLVRTRSEIMSAVDAVPAFAGLLLIKVPAGGEAAFPTNANNTLRAISPKTITGPADNKVLLDFFDKAIDDAFTRWKTTPLTVKIKAGPDVVYTGQADANAARLDFYAGTEIPDPVPAKPAFSIPRFTSKDVWQCAGPLATGDDDEKDVQKTLAAAFNRGVVKDSLKLPGCSTGAGSFYPANATFNPWAKMFHGCSANWLAYGFPYDDVCDQNPTVALKATSVTITIGNL